MPSPLRDYQLEAISRAIPALKEHGGFLFNHDPGMGKTLELITTARLLKVHRVVVVCPVVAQGVWTRELARWWPGMPVESAENEWKILTYDQLRVRGDTLRALCEWRPELVVFDEIQYVKNPQADRTKAAAILRGWSIYCVGLSGTPQHSLIDLYSEYRILTGHKVFPFGQSFSEFKRWLCVFPPGLNFPKKNKHTGELVFRPGAREAIAKAVEPLTHSADASLMNVPEPVVTRIPVELSEAEEVAYGAMEDTLRAELPDGSEAQAEIVLTKLLRLTQITAGHATNTEGDTVTLGTSKLDATLELLDERPNQKVVIACRFRADIAAIMAALNARGRPCTKIDGGTPARLRTQYEDWFERGKHDNGVIILQYQAGGVAITLASARTLILYTLDPSVIRYRQMIGRVWRLGQRGVVEVLPLIATGTQDDYCYTALERGADNAQIAKLLVRFLHHR